MLIIWHQAADDLKDENFCLTFANKHLRTLLVDSAADLHQVIAYLVQSAWSILIVVGTGFVRRVQLELLVVANVLKH